MEDVDWEDLARKVTEIKRNTVSARSRAVYKNSYGRFIAWIVINRPHLVSPVFGARLGDTTGLSIKQMRKLLKPLLDCDVTTPPLRFEALQMDEFGAWLLTLEKPDGSSLSYSALNTHRAGLFNLYRDYGLIIPATMEKELQTYFKGLKRERATAAARGEVRTKTGKDPLSFDLYSFLCGQLISHSSKDMIFARTYMVVAWNLMCRSANAFGIRHGHIEWSGDALCIYFAHQKNDQEGTRPRDPKHIYANPLNPSICPVLAIAMFWATSSFDGSDLLFPGNSQYERFRKCLHRLFDRADTAEELRRRGISGDDLGTHSMRKGAATFCASGSTACPSSTAVHLRAGWSLGGVQNTYLRYESAGDMHVGRTVSGLPPDSHKFAVLPPHFGERDDVVDKAVHCVFPGLPSQLSFVGEFCLASLVYHAPYLQSKLDAKHSLLESPLFQHPTLLMELSPRLYRIDDNSTRLHATGVPPHVSILREIKTLLEVALKTVEHVDAARTGTVKDVMAVLEERAIGAGVVTFDGLDNALKRCLESAGVAALVEKLNTKDHQTNTQEDENDTYMYSSHFWGGKFRRVPADFDLPDCSVSALWVLWQCGNASKKTPPLRVLDGRDMPNRNLQKRLSDARYLMRMIEDEAKRTGLWRARESVADALNTFAACSKSVEVPEQTTRKRKRRRGQLSWISVVALHRRARKQS